MRDDFETIARSTRDSFGCTDRAAATLCDPRSMASRSIFVAGGLLVVLGLIMIPLPNPGIPDRLAWPPRADGGARRLRNCLAVASEPRSFHPLSGHPGFRIAARCVRVSVLQTAKDAKAIVRPELWVVSFRVNDQWTPP